MGQRVAAAKTPAEALDAAFAEVDGDEPKGEGGGRETPRGDDAKREEETREDPPKNDRELAAEQQARRREPVEDKPEEDPDEVISYRGHPVKLKKSKVAELAEKGFDYEAKQAKLTELRQAVEQDREGLDTYQQYRAWLKANPNAAKAISGLIQHYEEKGELPLVDFEKPSTDPESLEGRPHPGIMRALERISSRLDRIDTERATQDVATRLVRAVESNPILKRIADSSPEREKAVLQKLTDELKADPSANLEAVAQAVATEWSMVAETLGASKKYLDEKTEAKQRFRHNEHPDDTPPEPHVPEPVKLTGHDLKNGRVRREATAWMNRMFG